MPQSPQQAVSAVIIKNDSVLLIKRSNPPFVNTWNLPGGKVDEGESLEQAIAREVLEETNLTFTSPILLGDTTIEVNDKNGVQYNYCISVFTGAVNKHQDAYIDPTAGGDAEELQFVPISKLAKYDLSDKTMGFIDMSTCHPMTYYSARHYTVKGHLKTALIALFFGLAAYGFLFGLMKILRASGFQTF